MTPRATEPANDYIALPPAGQGKGVLVIHAWWGLNAFFRGVCDRLAGEGFVAFAPDLFQGQVATTVDAARALRDRPRREPIYKTLIRAIAKLTDHPATQGSTIGVVGFSMGGHWALWLSQRPELPFGAAVTFYGARSGDYSASRAAFQGHFAENDEWVSDAARKKLGKSLDAAGRIAEFHAYPGTGHWFFEADRADAYDAPAAELAWQRTVAFLRAHVAD
jgi:carboxymethylenebutenolidase